MMNVSPTVTVVTSPDSDKARSFSATVLGCIQADEMLPCEPGKGSVIRPVWLAVGASEDAMRPFLANLRTGRRASPGNRSGDVSYELLKTAGYHYATQRTASGVVALAFLPDLFRVDPGMVDPSGIQFIAMPSQTWLEAQRNSFTPQESERAIQHVARIQGVKNRVAWEERVCTRNLLPMATLFCAYLDRRTRCPLIPDIAFQLQLLCAMMENNTAFGWHEPSRQLRGTPNIGLGYVDPIGCSAIHSEFEELLAGEVAKYMETKP
jgi:hypothetical protein